MPRRLPVVFSLALFSLDLGCTSDDSPGTDEVSAGDTMGTDGTDTMGTDTMGTDTTGTDTTGELSGQELYVSFCSACHGPEGKGNPMLGAPNLGDTTWLYGGDQATIERTLRDGRNGRMPAFGQTLNADKVRLVAAYVYSLSQ